MNLFIIQTQQLLLFPFATNTHKYYIIFRETFDQIQNNEEDVKIIQHTGFA